MLFRSKPELELAENARRKQIHRAHDRNCRKSPDPLTGIGKPELHINADGGDFGKLIAFDTTSRNSNLRLIGFVRDHLARLGVPVPGERLWLPLISNAVYGYQAVNVESQQRNPTSLLHWTRRLIEVRERLLQSARDGRDVR